MKKFSVYTRNDITNLKDFLINSLGFSWSENMQKSPPVTAHSRIIFLSDLRISWVHSDKLPEEFTLLEYKKDRTKFLHVLKKMYGDKISIPDNTHIHLSDERIELIKDMLEYYKDKYKWQDTEKIVTLEIIIDNGYYVYKHSDMLNELVNEYKNQTDTNDVGGTAGKRKLDMNLDDLMDRVTDGSIDPAGDLFQELLKGLETRREQERRQRRTEAPLDKWEKVPGGSAKKQREMYETFMDKARQKPVYVDKTKTSDDQKSLDNDKISSDQINDGWMDMTKDFISDMWRNDGSKR